MLTNSDNDIAEALARQTAVATGKRASFDGGASAIAATLKKLELPSRVPSSMTAAASTGTTDSRPTCSRPCW